MGVLARKKGNPTLTDRVEMAEGEVGSLSEKVTELTGNLNAILGSLQGMEKWIPSVDASVKELRQAVDQVNFQVTILENRSQETTTPKGQMPEGHCVEENHQGNATGASFAQERPLVKCKSKFPQSPVNFDLGENSERESGGSQSFEKLGGPRLPKTDFPKFDGENPKLWKTNSEKYFGMYHVPYETWASFATLHFTGTAALWLQTYEELHCVESWPELVVAVHSKFGRDKYQQHLEELENFRQLGSVDEYHTKFEELMHKVLVYNKAFDETFFVTKFVGGLKNEIKAAIKLHKPRTVDTTFSLAKTQDDLLGETNVKSSGKTSFREPYKPSSKTPFSGKGILGSSPDENKKVEKKPRWEERFDSLKAARRARGECFKCGEKYGPRHKCPKSVQLHVLEKLLEVFLAQEGNSHNEEETEGTSDEELMLTECAMSGTTGKRTIRLQGLLQNQEILVLVDSGSFSNFLSEQLVSKLQLPTQTSAPSQVTIADGGKILCNQVVANLEWWCQGHTFSIDLKVLSLDSYDMILGMEWLEDFSPMWIDWKRKKMRFTYAGNRITLVGVKE